MSTIDLNDYVAGGYFITRYAIEGYWKSPLLPTRVMSLSSCFSKTVNIYWLWDVEKHKAEIIDFGIPNEKLLSLRTWNTDAIDFPNVFYTLGAAQQFIAEFLSDDNDLLVLGAALPAAMVEDFLAAHQQTVYDPTQQLWIPKTYGVNYILTSKQSLPRGGEIRGFEILSYDLHINHSWLCSNIEKDMHELYGIHPNRYGLINTYEEAKTVYKWIAEDNMQGGRAEPEPYYPWLIVQYPVTSKLE